MTSSKATAPRNVNQRKQQQQQITSIATSSCDVDNNHWHHLRHQQLMTSKVWRFKDRWRHLWQQQLVTSLVWRCNDCNATILFWKRCLLAQHDLFISTFDRWLSTLLLVPKNNKQYRITSCNQLKDSVTRCCKISPLWQHLKRLWILFEDLLALGKIFNIICTNCICYWTIFHFCKCPKIEQIILPSGHTALYKLDFDNEHILSSKLKY